MERTKFIQRITRLEEAAWVIKNEVGEIKALYLEKCAELDEALKTIAELKQQLASKHSRANGY